jgi:two-component system, chemotaxis family, protein-glutamate methylesterase/glutaminase
MVNPNQPAPVRVLIVDDSALVRATLTRELGAQTGILVVGAAPDPFVARDMIGKLSPDVLILDIEMPRMDGLTFLRKIMKFAPIPTIIVSSLTKKGCAMAMACMESGAVGVYSKPGEAYSIGDLSQDLGNAVRGARGVKLRRIVKPAGNTPQHLSGDALLETTHKVVAIGTSTGGTEALKSVLGVLPANCPGIVIVQHMPPLFTKAFAERLNGLSRLRVKEAEDGDFVTVGQALIAPGDHQMNLRREGARYRVRIDRGPKVCRHRPSAEVLFESVARYAGSNSMGVIMTGMGDDGATGLGSMRKAGAFTIAQDEKSCVVFGMPREAIERGSADEVVSLDGIPRRIVDYASGKIPKKNAPRKAS